jgi:hypothetical protein
MGKISQYPEDVHGRHDDSLVADGRDAVERRSTTQLSSVPGDVFSKLSKVRSIVLCRRVKTSPKTEAIQMESGNLEVDGGKE